MAAIRHTNLRFAVLLVLSYTLFFVIPDIVMTITKTTNIGFMILAELSYIADLFIFILMDPGVMKVLRRKKHIYNSQKEVRRRKVAVVQYHQNSIMIN